MPWYRISCISLNSLSRYASCLLALVLRNQPTRCSLVNRLNCWWLYNDSIVATRIIHQGGSSTCPCWGKSAYIWTGSCRRHATKSAWVTRKAVCIRKNNTSEGKRYQRDIQHIRHHSLIAPHDFDVSPSFKIIKSTLDKDFDFQKPSLSRKTMTIRAAAECRIRVASSCKIAIY